MLPEWYIFLLNIGFALILFAANAFMNSVFSPITNGVCTSYVLPIKHKVESDSHV